MKKVIYVYKDDKDVNKSIYKVGKADQREKHDDSITVNEIASNRVGEQLSAATYGEYTTVARFDISHVDSSTVVENAIHNALELNGVKRLTRGLDGKKSSTEWFDFREKNEGQVIELVANLVEKFAGESGLGEYKPYAYQAYVKALLLEELQAGAKTIGAELAPRFGKTVWCLDTFKTMTEDFGYQYLILPAFVLSAHSSFQKELRGFKDFKDMLFISDQDDDFVAKVRNNKDKVLVIANSLHIKEMSLDKLKCIAELDVAKKVAFIDEADFGAHTENSKKVIDVLDIETKVLMTGTAIERAVAGYDTPSMIQWSYMDMLMLKDGIHPILSKLSA